MTTDASQNILYPTFGDKCQRKISILKVMSKMTASQCQTDAELMNWVDSAISLIDSGAQVWEIPNYYMTGSIRSEKNRMVTSGKKVVDLYSIFKFAPHALEYIINDDYDAIIKNGTFDKSVAFALASRGIKKTLDTLNITEEYQLYYCMSIRSYDAVQRQKLIKEKTQRIRGAAINWFLRPVRPGRQLSKAIAKGESARDQCDSLISMGYALLCTGGKVQAAANLLGEHRGEIVPRPDVHNAKRRIERILNLKTPVDVSEFWALKVVGT